METCIFVSHFSIVPPPLEAAHFFLSFNHKAYDWSKNLSRGDIKKHTYGASKLMSCRSLHLLGGTTFPNADLLLKDNDSSPD